MSQIELMGHTIPVVAQPINRLARNLDAFQKLFTPEAEVNVESISGGVYDLLVTVAPEVSQRIPRYRFLGFESQADQDASEQTFGPLDGPTLPEVREAFRGALDVNGFDMFSGLKKLVDPTLIQAVLSGLLEDVAREVTREVSKNISSTSRSQNGARGSTSSSPPPRTLESSGAGRSRGSKRP